MYKFNATKLLSVHIVALLVVMNSMLFSQNNPPTGGNEYLAIDEDAPVTWIGNLLTNDSDIDGDSLWISNASSSVPGAFVSNNMDGSLDYYTALNYCGVDTIIYAVTDGLAVILDTLFLTINCINDAPTNGNETINMNEDDPTVTTPDLLANNTDAEGDPLSIGTVSSPSGGTLIDNGNGTYDYTPNPDWCGIDTIYYEVTDGNSITIDMLIFNVACINDLPVGGNESITIDEDGPLTNSGLLLANDSDVDGGNLTIGTITSTGGGTWVLVGTTINYTPDPDFCGEDTIVYEVSDGIGFITDTLFITVTCINDAPTGGNETVYTDIDVALLNIDILANDFDVEGGVLTVTSPAFPYTTASGGTVTMNPDGTINYTPVAGFYGVDTMIYIVCDDDVVPLCVTDTIWFIVSTDTDGDGIVDFDDIDDDNDGIADVREEYTALNNGDTDEDGILDIYDTDSDNDGLMDIFEAGGVDSDNNGLVDSFVDGNLNGMDDAHEWTPLPLTDTDLDWLPDFQDKNDDNDTTLTIDEYDVNEDMVPDDCDGDGIPNYLDPDNCGIWVPEVFSPNWDGKNDYLIINGILDYPENDFQVFNRWGNLVYSAKPYTNNWAGKINVGLFTHAGDELPAGTYFYILDLGDGSDVYKGYIYLTR